MTTTRLAHILRIAARLSERQGGGGSLAFIADCRTYAEQLDALRDVRRIKRGERPRFKAVGRIGSLQLAQRGGSP